MSGDDPKKIVEFPKAEIVPEERARRLKIEVDRLANLPVVEWMYYLSDRGVAEKHGLSRADTKRASLSRRGYRRSQFDDAFARFLPQQSEPKQSEHSNIRTRGSERGNN